MNRFAVSLVAVCATCLAGDQARSTIGVLPSGSHPEAVQQQSVEYVLPELILGGEWTSTIRILNLGLTSIPTTNVYFIDNLGNPLSASFQTTVLLADGSTILGAPLTGPGFSFSLRSGGILEATFSGGTNTQFGHAFFGFCSTTAACSSAGVYAEVALTNTNAARPDFQSIFPLEQPATAQNMMWDSRNGNSNVLYLVNNNTTATLATIDFYGTAGQLIESVPVTFVGLGSQILTMETIAPGIVGRQGFLVIRASNASTTGLLTATALRINPTDSFTPVRAFVQSH
jgi:hypothetical protein